MRTTWILSGALAAAATAAGQEAPEPLRPWLPPGVERAELERALDDDLGSGLAGALPLALVAAAVDLEPERFGGSIDAAYARYGFPLLEGRALPAGIVGLERLGVRAHQFNCLACHAGPDPSAPGRWVMGAPNARIDFTGWFQNVYRVGRRAAERERDARVAAGEPVRSACLTLETTRRLTAAARRGLARGGARPPSPTEVAALAVLARGSVEAVLGGASGGAPDYGPGRTVVQAAYRALRFDMDPGPYAPIAPPDLFGVRHRETLLWTGNETYEPGTTPGERVARNGMLVPWIQLHPFTREPVPDALTLLRYPRYRRMGELLARSAPPPAPAPATPAEAARVARGQAVFARRCAGCHGRYALEPARTPAGGPGLRARVVDYPEAIVPIERVGTDPAYAEVSDADFLRAFEGSLLGRAGLFRGRVTGGYVARPLLGLRLRAPFLHNDSVPNLAALLTPPAERPRRFLVGPGVPHDAAAVGLRHDPARLADPPAGASVRETTGPGDRATGHAFGTDLSPAQREALLAFLRRL